MNIGIITQPLAQNYGGILQNFALQKVLKSLGHNVYTVNKRNIFLPYNYLSFKDKIIWRIKQFIKKYIGREYYASLGEFQVINQHFTEFVQKNIITTERYASQEQLQKIVSNYNFEAYVVGSDQVWRPIYTDNIYNDFLGFCEKLSCVKRIAYAASFGVDSWEFSNEQTNECSRLARMFDAISVREDSGIALCKAYLGVEAIQVLDPTMLLEKEEYIKLINTSPRENFVGDMFCYILDYSSEIETAIKHIEDKCSLTSFQVKEKKHFSSIKIGDDLKDYIIPSPAKWLQAFMDAKLIFTDSFHGCVFSIIFNKPFWVIGNKWRGNARFDSLLKTFNLENRRIQLNEIENINLALSIDWENVNLIKKELQATSLDFLKRYF